MPEGSTASDGRRRALLLRVCERCVDELGADHASISIALGSGELVSGAATSADIADLDECGFHIDEGPCSDAVRDHQPVVVPDLDTEQWRARWPAWSNEAAKREIRAATALPIEIGGAVVGALALYARTPWQLDDRRFQAAQQLRGVALLVLLDITLSTPDHPELDAVFDAGGDELAVLLRGDVHAAAGMVAAQSNLPIGQALSRLHAYAFAVDRPLPAVAADVIAGRLHFDDSGSAD